MHYNRNRNNDHPPSEEDAINSGWRKLPDDQSVYRQQGEGNEDNRKYVSPDGKKEAVFDSEGDPVYDDVNMGTYNYKSPDDKLGHMTEDVLPYWKYGNTEKDPTPLIDRLHPKLGKTTRAAGDAAVEIMSNVGKMSVAP